MNFSARVIRAREHAKLTQDALAKAVGVKQQSVTKWETTANASRHTTKIASVCGVRPEWLADGEPPMLPGEVAPLPLAAYDGDWESVTGYAQAVGLGAGAEAQEYAETHSLKFKASSLRKRGIYGHPLHVYYGKGDSMAPAIKDGDAILFDSGDTRPLDGVLFVVQIGKEIYVKRAEILDDAVYFRSDNPNGDHGWRKPRRMDNKKTPITIVGRVHWVGGWAD